MQFMIFSPILIALLFTDAKPKACLVGSNDEPRVIAIGVQPDIIVDKAEKITIAYGVKGASQSQVYTITSLDGGKTFTKPFELGSFPKMGLGMGRGPQITTTRDYTVVTVGSHYGQLYAMRYSKAADKWSQPVKINDTDSTAKEALSDIAAGLDNTLYTVWLDTRLGNNNLYGARSKDGGMTWEKNQLIYKGTQDGICDCCRPSVFIDQAGSIKVMFRNKLDGARNMYLITSEDNGQHFGQAQKLGTGDFMINGCPMDGGDLAGEGGNVTTVWRRQMDVFVAELEKPEIKLGPGRTPVILRTVDGDAIAWQQDGTIQFRWPSGKTISLGNGQYPKLAMMANSKTVLVSYERDGKILVSSIGL